MSEPLESVLRPREVPYEVWKLGCLYVTPAAGRSLLGSLPGGGEALAGSLRTEEEEEQAESR